MAAVQVGSVVGASVEDGDRVGAPSLGIHPFGHGLVDLGQQLPVPLHERVVVVPVPATLDPRLGPHCGARDVIRLVLVVLDVRGQLLGLRSQQAQALLDRPDLVGVAC